MPSEEEIKAQQELLFAHRRTLFVLLKQRAQIAASYVPPAVATGIEDTRDQIRRIKQNLRAMGIPIDDQQNDEEAPLPQPDAIGRVQFGSAGTAKSRNSGWYIGAFGLLVALGAVSLVLLLIIRPVPQPISPTAIIASTGSAPQLLPTEAAIGIAPTTMAIAPTPTPPLPTPPSPTPPTAKSHPQGLIYAITQNNELWWYRHDGRDDGSWSWTDDNPRTIGTGWDFKQIFSGDLTW
jgi:hypothetical protein